MPQQEILIHCLFRSSLLVYFLYFLRFVSFLMFPWFQIRYSLLSVFKSAQQMTFYFRPLSIEHSHCSDSPQNEGIKQLNKVSLILSAVSKQGGEHLLHKYELDMNSFIRDGQLFKATSANNDLKLRLQHQQAQKEYLGQAVLTIREVLENFQGAKQDQFYKQITIGKYKIAYQYRYNRFLAICGESVFKEWTLQHPNNSRKLISSLQEEQPQKNGGKNYKTNIIVRGLPEEDKQGANLLKLNGSLESSILPRGIDSKKIQFYKGPCKSVNLFSVLDSREGSTESQFKILEKPYNK